MAPDADARLRAQLEYLRSDERLRELARMAAELTPEERLAQAWEMSRGGSLVSGPLSDEARARVDALRGELGPNAERVLRRLATLGRPDGGSEPR
jgi:hypothetical protein